MLYLLHPLALGSMARHRSSVPASYAPGRTPLPGGYCHYTTRAFVHCSPPPGGGGDQTGTTSRPPPRRIVAWQDTEAIQRAPVLVLDTHRSLPLNGRTALRCLPKHSLRSFSPLACSRVPDSTCVIALARHRMELVGGGVPCLVRLQTGRCTSGGRIVISSPSTSLSGAAHCLATASATGATPA